MINVCNHRHVTDVGLFVHDRTDLVYCEVHLKDEKINTQNFTSCIPKDRDQNTNSYQPFSRLCLTILYGWLDTIQIRFLNPYSFSQYLVQLEICNGSRVHCVLSTIGIRIAESSYYKKHQTQYSESLSETINTGPRQNAL